MHNGIYIMTKAEAKELFGSTAKVCQALGIKPHTYYRFEFELPQKQSDQLMGAYLRTCEERDKLFTHVIAR